MFRNFNKKIIGITMSLALFCGIFAVIIKSNAPSKYDELTYDSFIASFQSFDNETHVEQYLDIEMKESLLEGIADDQGHEGISYQIAMLNVTEEPFDIFVKFFVPRELNSLLEISDRSFGIESGGSVTINPGKTFSQTAGFGIKLYDQLTPDEKLLFDTYKNDLYVYLLINSQEFYLYFDDLHLR